MRGKLMEINQWVDELFEVFDVDKDGAINRTEFVELIDVLLQDKGIRMCETIFHRFDKNHDNSISKDELKEMVIELAL
ncbi:MAG: Ca2+-binding EF-hand superfamily protein [Alteromonadaceae bacterium]|jgi:Ca2+-binding EF-hand superfamily protein